MDQKQIQTYFDVEDGTKLFPLRKRDKAPHPSMMDWPSKVVPIEQTMALIEEEGCNAGYRIPKGEMVIDMDPRNYEKDKKTQEEVESFVADALGMFEFSEVLEEFPVVVTGGGGYHIYLIMSDEWTGDGWSKGVDPWKKCVEFKRKGTYVVCAGSRHPNGNLYEWVTALRLGDRKAMPVDVETALGDLLTKGRSVSSSGAEVGGGDETWRIGVLSPEQLKRWVLDRLDVEDFAHQAGFFSFMGACHHATNGEGEEEFVAWCQGDEEYADQGHEDGVRNDWNTRLQFNKKGGQVTDVRSLMRMLTDKYGSQVGSAFSDHMDVVKAEHTRVSDFAGLEGEDGDGDGDVIDQYLEEIQEKEDFESVVPPKGCSELAANAAKGINKGSTGEDITAAVKVILHVKDGLLRQDLLEQVRVARDIKPKVFNGMITEAKEDNRAALNEDLPRLLAELTLRMKFYEGKGLVYTIGEQLWGYNGKYWSVVTKKWVEGRVTEVLDVLRKKVKIKKAENTLVNEAASVMVRLCAVNEDRLGLRNRPKSVVNCQNGEYWIDEGVLKPHRPESYLLQVLNFDYEQFDVCPGMDTLLAKTHERFADRAEKTRFIYQLIGYALDPDKHLDKWIMFHGSGGDGKSTIINIIMAFLGEAALPISIKDFEGTHTMSAVPGKLLIIDEDMDAKVKLPDGTLKKLSGHTQLSCDPKHAKREYFMPACTVLLCGNTLPITDDLTEAARRRPIVVPFDNDLHKEGSGGVKGIDQVIIREELPGVLNRALEERKIVKEQGYFNIPRSSVIATQNWIKQSNLLAVFVDEQLERTGDRANIVLLSDMYERYSGWCHANGVTKPSGKQIFRQGVEALGVDYDERLAGNKRGFRGCFLCCLEDFK